MECLFSHLREGFVLEFARGDGSRLKLLGFQSLDNLLQQARRDGLRGSDWVTLRHAATSLL